MRKTERPHFMGWIWVSGESFVLHALCLRLLHLLVAPPPGVAVCEPVGLERPAADVQRQHSEGAGGGVGVL